MSASETRVLGERLRLGEQLWLVAPLLLAAAYGSSASAQDTDPDPGGTRPADVADPSGPGDTEVEPGESSGEDPTEQEAAPRRARAAATRRRASTLRMHWNARHDVLVRWAPRYRLEVDPNPIGLEEQMWRRIEVLPMYHRVSLDVSNLLEGHVGLHLAGWGALDLFADSDGGVAAGDIAIAYADVSFDPVTLWVGRRFVTYGPPGGMHVDGGGVSARFDMGLIAEAFIGRPVTPTRTALLGPQTSFEGPALAYGARIGYSDPGRAGLSAAFTETWGHGIVGSRVVDSVAYWHPGEVDFEGGLKLDVLDIGVLQGQLTARWRPVREFDVDVGYAHLEPGRWIPRWSILSVFETSTYDELVVGGTLRPLRPLALRLVASGRRYDRVQSDEPSLGYRVALYGRVTPDGAGAPSVRAVIDRRDDGVVGYTLLQAGFAFDLIEELGVGVDGSYAIDDSGRRESILGRVSGDYRPSSEWTLGATLSIAATPIAPSEVRALLHLRWAEAS